MAHDLVHRDGGAPKQVRKARPIGHEAPHLHKLLGKGHSGQPVLGSEVHEPLEMLPEQEIIAHDERPGVLPGYSRKGLLEVIRTAHL